MSKNLASTFCAVASWLTAAGLQLTGFQNIWLASLLLSLGSCLFSYAAFGFFKTKRIARLTVVALAILTGGSIWYLVAHPINNEQPVLNIWHNNVGVNNGIYAPGATGPLNQYNITTPPNDTNLHLQDLKITGRHFEPYQSGKRETGIKFEYKGSAPARMIHFGDAQLLQVPDAVHYTESPLEAIMTTIQDEIWTHDVLPRLDSIREQVSSGSNLAPGQMGYFLIEARHETTQQVLSYSGEDITAINDHKAFPIYSGYIAWQEQGDPTIYRLDFCSVIAADSLPIACTHHTTPEIVKY